MVPMPLLIPKRLAPLPKYDLMHGYNVWGEISVKITHGCSRSIRVYGLLWCGVLIWVAMVFSFGYGLFIRVWCVGIFCYNFSYFL